MIAAVVLYYIASASAVLFYGIGIARTISMKEDASRTALSCVKALSCASATASVSFLVNCWLLVPVGLSELFPFVSTLVFLVFSALIEIFIGVGIGKSPAEFSVTLLSVLISLNEGLSVGHAVVIACSCVASFYLVVLIFRSIRSRVGFYTDPRGIRVYPVLFLSLAVVILAIFGWNLSWLNVLGR